MPSKSSLFEPSANCVIRRAVVPSVLVMFFLICAGSPPGLRADPISFTITWTLSSGAPAPGPTTYTYDPDDASFAGFIVTWSGITYDFAARLNTFESAFREGFQERLLVPHPTTSWRVAQFETSGAWRFRIVTDGTPAGIMILGAAGPPAPPSPDFSEGTFTVAQTSVPEPATLTLCGIGLGGLLLTRSARSKRRKRFEL